MLHRHQPDTARKPLPPISWPQMQLYFNTPATWNKRIQLRLSGEPSLTMPLLGHKYGKVRSL